jgi:ADP-heptose:LPS heptosyltransferase
MEQPSWEKRLAIRLFDALSPLWIWAIRRKTGTRLALPKRITLLAFWGIGDAVLLTPLLRALRRRYPGAWIELIGESFLRHLYAHDSCVNEITVYAPPWVAPTRKYRFWSPKYVELIRWLAKRRDAENDWVVTTRGDIREHLVAALMGGRRRFGYGDGGGTRLLTDTFSYPSPKKRRQHYAEYSSEVAGQMGCPDDGGGPRLMLLEDERERALEFLRSSGWQGERPLLGVHVGAAAPIRRWPVDRFQSVLDGIRQKIGWLVIIGDPESNWHRLKLPAGLGGSKFSGSLREVLALLSHFDVLLCNDGGIMHAAVALGVRVVAIFGPTCPAWFGPYGEGNRVVLNENIPCRPCRDICRFSKPVCMETVTIEQVRSAMEDLVSISFNNAVTPR